MVETCCVYLLHDPVCKSLKLNHDEGWDCIQYLPLYAIHVSTKSLEEVFHLVLILTVVQSGSKIKKMNSNMLL